MKCLSCLTEVGVGEFWMVLNPSKMGGADNANVMSKKMNARRIKDESL